MRASRPRHNIETDDKENQKYSNARRGSRTDTKELHINLKTLTLGLLRPALLTHELTHPESQALNLYSRSPPSFHSLLQLFSVASLRLRCLQYYSGTAFIRTFFSSPRMHRRNKLLLVKFLAKIWELARAGGSHSLKWKENPLHNF